VRCGYSLRGLPARHACPECGLHFDERCELYRVRNPKAAILIWVLFLGGGWWNLENLPYLFSLAGASVWQKIGALAAVVYLIVAAFGAFYLLRLYRRGQVAAVTSDGLFLRLVGHNAELIPWEKIGEAKVKDLPSNKAQIARVYLKDKQKFVEFGGVANVFPTRADVDRFVGQVKQRAGLVKQEEP